MKRLFIPAETQAQLDFIHTFSMARCQYGTKLQNLD